jgi:tetratricopeptide (TPR) repeat protein
LQEFTRERTPLKWAAAQNNLGNVLGALGARESRLSLLEEAVSAYRNALQVFTRDHTPLDWATTQNNLGTALQTLGERERGTVRLKEAVAAHRAALGERARDRVPLQWAETQNNLGNALKALGEREREMPRLERMVAAFRAWLVDWIRDRVPLRWTRNNLGGAPSSLKDRQSGESGITRLQEALAAFDAALSVFIADGAMHNVNLTRGNRDRAASLLAARRP